MSMCCREPAESLDAAVRAAAAARARCSYGGALPAAPPGALPAAAISYSEPCVPPGAIPSVLGAKRTASMAGLSQPMELEPLPDGPRGLPMVGSRFGSAFAPINGTVGGREDAHSGGNGRFWEDGWAGPPGAAAAAAASIGDRGMRSIGSAELPLISSSEYEKSELTTMQEERGGGYRDDGWDPTAAAAAAVASAAAAFLVRGGISPQAFADIAKSALAAGNKTRAPQPHGEGGPMGDDVERDDGREERKGWGGDVEEYRSSAVESQLRAMAGLPAVAAAAHDRHHVGAHYH